MRFRDIFMQTFLIWYNYAHAKYFIRNAEVRFFTLQFFSGPAICVHYGCSLSEKSHFNYLFYSYESLQVPTYRTCAIINRSYYFFSLFCMPGYYSRAVINWVRLLLMDFFFWLHQTLIYSKANCLYRYKKKLFKISFVK